MHVVAGDDDQDAHDLHDPDGYDDEKEQHAKGRAKQGHKRRDKQRHKRTPHHSETFVSQCRDELSSLCQERVQVAQPTAGALNWLATRTRPDISLAAHKCSTFIHVINFMHFHAFPSFQ